MIGYNICRHDVLSLVGPESGTCSPGCAVTLNWLFTPVLPELHQVDIPVHIGTGSYTMVHKMTVAGKGVVSTVPEEHVSEWESSARRRHHIPSNPFIQLSPVFLDLGDTICNGCMRRLLVLESSAQEPMWFQWLLGEFDGCGASEGVLSFEPCQGELQPGERLACLVTYNARLATQYLQGEVVLLVANSEELLCEGAAAVIASKRVIGTPLLTTPYFNISISINPPDTLEGNLCAAAIVPNKTKQPSSFL
jgi:hypothetical protein